MKIKLKKAEELKKFLTEEDFNLNLIIYEITDSNICSHNFDVVLGKESLEKDIYKKVDNIGKLKKIKEDLSESKNKMIPYMKNDISDLKNKVIPVMQNDILIDILQNLVLHIIKDIIQGINNKIIHQLRDNLMIER